MEISYDVITIDCPIMWNIVFNSLLALFKTGPYKAIGYADDGSILICGPDPFTLVGLLQQAIDKAHQWG